MYPSFIQSAVNRFLCTMHLVWVSPRPHSSWFHHLWPLNHSLGVFTCFLVEIKTAGSPFLALHSLSCGYGPYQAFRLFTALSSHSVSGAHLNFESSAFSASSYPLDILVITHLLLGSWLYSNIYSTSSVCPWPPFSDHHMAFHLLFL